MLENDCALLNLLLCCVAFLSFNCLDFIIIKQVLECLGENRILSGLML